MPDLQATANLDNVAPAVALFVDRAAARRRGFTLTEQNYPAVAEICRRFDGLPLAIELAAAQVAVLSPETVLRRLLDHAPFLVNGPRDLPARHQTLDAAVAWSYDLLEPAQKAVFRWCGVFVGGATGEAVSGVCPSEEVFGVLVQLGTKSLLELIDDGTELPRFHMLETIRECAIDLLRLHGELPDARLRHAEYYVELAETVQRGLRGGGMADALARLGREYDNLWSVLDWASETDHLELGLRMAAAAVPLLVPARHSRRAAPVARPGAGAGWRRTTRAAGGRAERGRRPGRGATRRRARGASCSRSRWRSGRSSATTTRWRPRVNNLGLLALNGRNTQQAGELFRPGRGDLRADGQSLGGGVGARQPGPRRHRTGRARAGAAPVRALAGDVPRAWGGVGHRRRAG